MKRLKVGSIFKIPLHRGSNAYGQYVYADERQGPLVQIFDLLSKEEASLKEIQESKPLFPPIVAGVGAAMRIGMWKVIGQAPVKNFKYPKFIGFNSHDLSGKNFTWFLWDGKKDTRLGTTLPYKYKGLEQIATFAPGDITERIERTLPGWRNLTTYEKELLKRFCEVSFPGRRYLLDNLDTLRVQTIPELKDNYKSIEFERKDRGQYKYHPPVVDAETSDIDGVPINYILFILKESSRPYELEIIKMDGSPIISEPDPAVLQVNRMKR